MTAYNGTYRNNDPTYKGASELYKNPKEAFKLVGSILEEHFGSAPFSLLDAGCASGAFLYYLHSRLTLSRSAGLDIANELLDQARQWVPQADFVEDSLLEPRHVFTERFDACTCLGTMNVFDDPEPVLATLLGYVKPGGSLLVWDHFGDETVDVIIRYRDTGPHGDGQWHKGLNVFSTNTMKTLLRALDPEASLFWRDFVMPFDLPRGDNPMRQWTTRVGDAPRAIMVGTGQILPSKVMIIRKGGER